MKGRSVGAGLLDVVDAIGVDWQRANLGSSPRPTLLNLQGS